MSGISDSLHDTKNIIERNKVKIFIIINFLDAKILKIYDYRMLYPAIPAGGI
jgi:hypothetical protein